jgi:hypothetical protein
MNSQKFFLILSIITLVIFLVVSVRFFIQYRRMKMPKDDKATGDISVTSAKFPPFPSKCPDYWTTLPNGRCKNTKKIGICKTRDGANIMDFEKNEIFKGENGPLAKCDWANKCEAPWEGIDNLC